MMRLIVGITQTGIVKKKKKTIGDTIGKLQEIRITISPKFLLHINQIIHLLFYPLPTSTFPIGLSLVLLLLRLVVVSRWVKSK